MPSHISSSVSGYCLWVQVCWEKFTRYFDVEERFVHLTNDCFVLTPEKAIELVDENTIGRPPVSCLHLTRSSNTLQQHSGHQT